MATSYNRRSSSPYRSFYKPASVDGQIAGITHFSSRGRSLTPTRVRAMPTSTFKFKFASPPVHSSRPASYGYSSFSSSSFGSPASNSSEKENVIVTVRFRPLSLREIQRGDEVAWYADGDNIVRSEYNPSTAYGFDRVFGPATTTKVVYAAAARLVVKGAMEGVNGTVFAYGVTSSGKTHTMHGDQTSPGIIPLAVKDVFNIIQETPGREYLLRVSYLEIYNEVINDLLDPAGQNLRIREDSQGTYVEGVKEEVVLSPAHALSLVAAGEELRHVGSNNFNLLSSRSHTIFTLTIESSSRMADPYEDDVIQSQLNLIDLAGSESSKTETTGLRRKEGSYINKSLLTLGTVIGKLSDGKASHVPYRDSKLTRLLQSSLNGFGRVSLICTLTPASSNIEETHNTLKFAHRAKHVSLQAAPNRILDEKSLIKKYQREISSLRQELEQLKRGMLDRSPSGFGPAHEDLVTLRQQLEAGQVKLQSRLEEEEQAKAALLGRIQRLTKLILVSTKNTTLSQEPEVQWNHRRRHSFGEENSNGSYGSMNLDIESHTSASCGDSISSDITSTASKIRRASLLQKADEQMSVVEPFNGSTQAGELFSVAVHGRRRSLAGDTAADEMDLLKEQVKMLTGEVALCTSSLKRMSEQAQNNAEDTNLQVQMTKVRDDITEKKRQMEILEKHILDIGQAALIEASPMEMSEAISRLMGKLNQKEFELEIKSADNRILQEQLQSKAWEIKNLQDTIQSLQEKLSDLSKCPNNFEDVQDGITEYNGCMWSTEESSLNATSYQTLQKQIFLQAAEMEKLKLEKVQLMEENGGLRIQSQKLTEEASYAQELASAAAVELKNLADEVTKISLQKSKLSNDLLRKEAAFSRQSKHSDMGNGYHQVIVDPRFKVDNKTEVYDDIDSWNLDPEDVRRELHARKEREASLEACLADKEQIESVLRKKLEDAKQREVALENDLAGMWVLVGKMRNDKGVHVDIDVLDIPKEPKSIGDDAPSSTKLEGPEEGQSFLQLQLSLEVEKQKNAELESLASKLKSEELEGLQLSALEELQNLHMEALTKICQAKSRQIDNEREQASLDHQHDDERNNHICKVCFEAPTAAVLLPCRHFCLCKPCAVACSECPLCRSRIADRIITFTA